MAGNYETVPGTGADAYKPIDPSGYTEQAAGNIYGAPAQNLMNQGLGGFSAWNSDSVDPNSFMSQYLNDFGQLTGAITGATSDLSSQLSQQVKDLTGEATTEVGSQMAGLGALRSSGMGRIAGERAGEISSRAGVDLANAQLNLLNNQGGQAMGGRINALSQMMGMPLGMMGLQGQFGEPIYTAPQVEKAPGALDWMSGAGNLASGIGSIIPF